MTDEATRARLQNKAAAGKATKEDLIMLRAACRNLGDGACMGIVRAATERLKQPK